MISPLNNSRYKNGYNVNFCAFNAVHSADIGGKISKKSFTCLKSVITAYKEIFNKIGLFSEKELAVIEKRFQNVSLYGPEKGIEFITPENYKIKVNMPEFKKCGNIFNLVIKKGDDPAESIFIKEEFITNETYTKFLNQKEIDTGKIDDKIQKSIELIDFPFLKLRRYIANDPEISKTAEKLKAEMLASEKAQALVKMPESAQQDEKFKNYVFQNIPEKEVKIPYYDIPVEEVLRFYKPAAPKKVKKEPVKTVIISKTPVVKEKNPVIKKTRTQMNPPITKKRTEQEKTAKSVKKNINIQSAVPKINADYGNSLITPAQAYKQAAELRNYMTEAKKMLDEYTKSVQINIRNNFPHYKDAHLDTIIKFKNIGKDNYKLDFRLGKTPDNKEFYYLAVLDKDDTLLKAFVTENNKIVDASDINYPIRDFIPKKQELVTPEEQKDYVDYMNILKENLEKYQNYLKNKGWLKNNIAKFADYGSSLITPAKAFEQAAGLRMYMIDSADLLNKYSRSAQVSIRNNFPYFDFSYGNTVIKFKNIGKDNYKLAFRLGKTPEDKEFYNLAVFDKDDKLLKSFVSTDNRIVDASTADYPLSSIPRRPLLVTAEEQKDFVEYMNTLKEYFEKYKNYLENKDWRIKKPAADYSISIITPAAAFKQSADCRKILTEIQNRLRYFSDRKVKQIKNNFPDYEYLNNDSVIRLKNIGKNNHKLAFSHCMSKDNQEFYYMAVLDNNNNMLKAFVIGDNKIVNASDLSYPVKNFIPDRQELVTPEEQKDFVEYMNILKSKLHKFNTHIPSITAYEESRNMHKSMKNILGEMSRYSYDTRTKMKNRFPNFDSSYEDTVLKFKNLGKDNYKIAFRFNTAQNGKHFYYLSVADKDDKLLKAYVVTNNKIVDAGKYNYIVKSFIPKEADISADEQKVFAGYLELFKEKLSEYSHYVKNKGWHKSS